MLSLCQAFFQALDSADSHHSPIVNLLNSQSSLVRHHYSHFTEKETDVVRRGYLLESQPAEGQARPGHPTPSPSPVSALLAGRRRLQGVPVSVLQSFQIIFQNCTRPGTSGFGEPEWGAYIFIVLAVSVADCVVQVSMAVPWELGL